MRLTTVHLKNVALALVGKPRRQTLYLSENSYNCEFQVKAVHTIKVYAGASYLAVKYRSCISGANDISLRLADDKPLGSPLNDLRFKLYY